MLGRDGRLVPEIRRIISRGYPVWRAGHRPAYVRQGYGQVSPKLPRRTLPAGRRACTEPLCQSTSTTRGLNADRQGLKLPTASASESYVSKTVNSFVIASRSVMRFVRLTSLSLPP